MHIGQVFYCGSQIKCCMVRLVNEVDWMSSFCSVRHACSKRAEDLRRNIADDQISGCLGARQGPAALSCRGIGYQSRPM